MSPASDLTWAELLAALDQVGQAPDLPSASRRAWQVWTELRARLLHYGVLELHRNPGAQFDDVEEIVDDLLLQFADREYRRRLRMVQVHAGYFRLILRRRIIDWQRREAREARARREIGFELHEPPLPGEPDDPSRPVSEEPNPFDKLRDLIAQLPPIHREILELRIRESMDFSEIAAVLSISPNAARVRWHRAIRFLKEKAEEQRGGQP